MGFLKLENGWRYPLRPLNSSLYLTGLSNHWEICGEQVCLGIGIKLSGRHIPLRYVLFIQKKFLPSIQTVNRFWICHNTVDGRLPLFGGSLQTMTFHRHLVLRTTELIIVGLKIPSVDLAITMKDLEIIVHRLPIFDPFEVLFTGVEFEKMGMRHSHLSFQSLERLGLVTIDEIVEIVIHKCCNVDC